MVKHTVLLHVPLQQSKPLYSPHNLEPNCIFHSQGPLFTVVALQNLLNHENYLKQQKHSSKYLKSSSYDLH